MQYKPLTNPFMTELNKLSARIQDKSTFLGFTKAYTTTYRNARVNRWADSHLHKRSAAERSERWIEAQRFT